MASRWCDATTMTMIAANLAWGDAIGRAARTTNTTPIAAHRALPRQRTSVGRCGIGRHRRHRLASKLVQGVRVIVK